MGKNPYRTAMERLPFSADLEEKTFARLKASSATSKKEDEIMTRQKKAFYKTKPFAIGGSLLATAACALLLVMPILEGSIDAKEPLLKANIDVDTQAVLNDTAQREARGLSAAEDASESIVSFMEDDSYVDYPPALMAPSSMPAPVGYSPYSLAPAWNTEEYTVIIENRFLSTLTTPHSTFAADVDTASYAKLRSSILEGRQVSPDSVRIEEMLNYFTYSYDGPQNDEPFGVTTEIAVCPWNPDSMLLLIGLQAEKIQEDCIPPQNLVFLIDVSGSMDAPNKLPLVKRAFNLLLDGLQPTDTVSIVTYASGDRVVLDGVRASERQHIMDAIDGLRAGGGTAGAQGIQTAYQLAERYFIAEGSNRVILATDGDFNIGISDEGSLVRLIEEKKQSGIFLSILGFGYGNYKDNKLEALADHGNGNYAYIDTIFEARKALVEEMGAMFLTVAKDVKLQVEFNPAQIKGYRLIGYENRTMAAEDFANDQKDGGEVGSGHRVTVLYEIVPVDSPMQIDAVETRYQTAVVNDSEEWLTLNIRCKAPDGDTSTLYTYSVDASAVLSSPSDNMRFASAVAETGMLLRDSEFKGTASFASVLERLRNTVSVTGDVYKEEFQYIVTLLDRQSAME